MDWRKVLRVSILAVIALALGWTFDTVYFKDKSTVKIGTAAPDFVAKQAGTDHKVQLSTLKGKGVVINFWGTWCSPCKQEMTDFEKASKAFANKGIVILAVNNGESELVVKSFAKQYGLTFPLVLDPSLEIAQSYQINPLPTTFFIKPNGTIDRKVEGGPMSLATIRSNIGQIVP